VSATIASAISDAEGFAIRSMPISPDELWDLRRQRATFPKTPETAETAVTASQISTTKESA
ncbi:MAG: hypothetical protein ABIP45_07335, partial [Knoellia sp.]